MSSKYQIWLKQNNSYLRFPVNPESVSISNETNIESIDIEGLGETSFVKSRNVKEISFSSEFPASYHELCEFEPLYTPIGYYGMVDRMKDAGPLQLIITNTMINMPVVITSFDCEEVGGDVGTLLYDIEFKEYRNPVVKNTITSSGGATRTPLASGGSTPTKVSVSSKPQRPSATSSQSKNSTYTVKKGDSLYKIAKVQLKNASRWKEIANLNNIKPKYIIHPGQVLVMPK